MLTTVWMLNNLSKLWCWSFSNVTCDCWALYCCEWHRGCSLDVAKCLHWAGPSVAPHGRPLQTSKWKDWACRLCGRIDLTQTWVRNKELCVSPRGQILKYMQRLSLHTLTGTINLIIVYPKNVSKSINILLKLFHSRVFVGLGFEKSLTQMPRQRKLLNCGRCFNLWGPLFPWDQEAPACVLHLWYVR